MLKKITALAIAALMLLGWTGQSWAPTATATANVTAILGSRLSLVLGVTKDRQGNLTSVCTDPAQILFDKFDSEDVADGDPGFMYAPYRKIAQDEKKNWHVAKMVANGTGAVNLKVDAVLTGINRDNLRVWFGGFWRSGAGSAEGGTESVDNGPPNYGWEAMGSSKGVSGAFVGICPFNYQLKVADVAAGTYSGTVTYTLTQ